jgi:hypothetical protein
MGGRSGTTGGDRTGTWQSIVAQEAHDAARPCTRLAMNTKPDGNAEQKFQELLTKLLDVPSWSEKQQLELEMARDISVEMLRIAEEMRDGASDLETCLILLKYAKVLDFVMSSLAARRDIKPQTLRVIFKLAGLKVDEAYPG